MPIEFRCSRCGKLLRTGDGTAGRQAQCPDCGTIGTVPGPAQPPEAAVPTLAPLGGDSSAPPDSAAGSPFASAAAPAGGQPAAFQPAGPFGSQLPPDQLRAYAAQRISGPATALMVIAAIVLVLSLLWAAFWFLCASVVSSGAPLPDGRVLRGDDRAQVVAVCTMYTVVGVVWAALAVVILIGARKMRRLQSYGLAMIASIIAVIPCVEPCCVLTLPFGIWALVVLGDSSVKAAFQR